MGKKTLITFAALVVLSVGGWLAFANRNDPDEPLEITASSASSSEGGKRDLRTGDLEPGWIIVGGVKRPASDVLPAKKAAAEPSGKENDFPGYGVAPRIPADLNPQVKSAVEAIRTNKHPARLSVAIQPKPFDEEEFRANPKGYLETVEPARVWQSLQPGPGVPRLGMISPRFQTALQGDPVTLQVSAPPKAPVSFASFDGGLFSASRLNCVTVQANDEGVAEVEFIGTPGTIEDIHVLASSPLSSGQAKFIVNVRLPGNE